MVHKRTLQVGLVLFSNSATVMFQLNTHNTVTDIMNAIEVMPWKDQKTNTSGGTIVLSLCI